MKVLDLVVKPWMDEIAGEFQQLGPGKNRIRRIQGWRREDLLCWNS
jgi:hypothetical protein